MDACELIQGSDAWKAARLGSVGASRMAEVVASTKSSGYAASRANLMAELLCERLTGTPTEKFVSAPMQWGVDNEAAARALYEFRNNCEVTQVGLIRHPTIEGTHASPDGLIGNDGLLEIKCPGTAVHVDTLLTRRIPEKYVKQMLWQMCCCERQWADYCSFDPRLPVEMRLFVSRVHRDQGAIDILEKEVRLFLADLDAKEKALRAQFMREAA